MTLREEDEFDPNDNEDELLSLGDRPLGATEYGVTAEEERTPELLEDRLRREEPDVVVGLGDEVGRLVEADQGVAGLDHERDAVATAVDDTEALSAEEAAVHPTDL